MNGNVPMKLFGAPGSGTNPDLHKSSAGLPQTPQAAPGLQQTSDWVAAATVVSSTPVNSSKVGDQLAAETIAYGNLLDSGNKIYKAMVNTLTIKKSQSLVSKCA